MLILLQFVVAFLAARIGVVRRAVKSEPVILLLDGEFLEVRLREERLSPEEVYQAIRGSGVGGTELVASVVLETDGSLSVITRSQQGSGSALPHQHG